MKDLSARSILITGASGFIGRELVKRFEQAGWITYGIGRRPQPQPTYCSWDLSKPFSAELQERYKHVDVILHAAARSSPWGSRREFLSSNVQATQNMVTFAEQSRIPRILFISSSSVFYRSQDQIGITEQTPHAIPAVNLYAESKQLAEKVIEQFNGSWCILRPRAVYGAGDTVLFPRILAAAKAGRLPLLIRRGTPVIADLLSVSNLVHCCYHAACNDSITGDFNLTDNHPIEVIPFLLEIFQRLNIAAPTRSLSVDKAYRFAWILEKIYQYCMPNREPPITRFGVHVFAYSKTFDVRKMLQTFGPPPQSVPQAVDEFIDWVQSASDPYGLATP